MIRGIIHDIETERHPKLREWLGTDEKIKRLDGMDVEQLRAVAVRHEIKLGNYKTLGAISKKIRAHFENQAQTAALKQYGAVICSIACKDVAGVLDDLAWVRDGNRLADAEGYEPPIVWTTTATHDEAAIIRAFLGWLEDVGPVVLMGFNIRGTAPGRKGFDIPMLRARCAVLGIPWPHWLPSTLWEDRRQNQNLFDICEVFSEGSCDSWLRMAGLPPKTASGADVERMTPTERAAYNGNDVELERLLAGVVLPTQPERLSQLVHRND